MADYFSRLLDRARGDAPLLERRTPQPFEARVDVGAWAGEGPALVRTDTDAAEEHTAAPTRDSVGPAAPGLHPRADAMRAPDRAEPAQPRAPGTAATLNAAVVSVERRDERPVAAVVHVDASLAPAPDPVRVPVSRPRQAAMGGSLDTLASGTPRHEEPSGARVERTESIRSASRLDDAPARVLRAAPIAGAAHVRATSVSRETRTPFAPVAPRVAPAPVASAERLPAPTIHVSIGRIEVRAVPAPPPARAQSSEQRVPRLSLDAYLRSRAGEGA